MIKLLIFDLDNCCFPTYTPQREPSTIDRSVFDPVVAVLEKEVSNEQVAGIKKGLFKWGIVGLLKRNNVNEEVIEKVLAVYPKIKATKEPQLFTDIAVLETLDCTKVLVTTGLTSFQESKISMLGVGKYFDEVIIHATDELLEEKNKEEVFARLLAKYQVEPSQVVVIGDSLTDELAAGKALGMITVQSLRPGVKKGEGVDYYIESFAELSEIIEEDK